MDSQRIEQIFENLRDGLASEPDGYGEHTNSQNTHTQDEIEKFTVPEASLSFENIRASAYFSML